jgi:hypothetical protein
MYVMRVAFVLSAPPHGRRPTRANEAHTDRLVRDDAFTVGDICTEIAERYRCAQLLTLVFAPNATTPAAAAESNHIFAVGPTNANATECTQFNRAEHGAAFSFVHVPGSD